MLSELPRNFAVTALGIALALTAVLFLYSIGLRLAHILHDRKQRQLRDRWWPIFSAATLAGNRVSKDRPILPRAKPPASVLREWCRFRSYVRGDCCSALEALATEMGLLSVAQKLFRRGSFRHQLLGAQALGFLKDRTSWSSIGERLDHPNLSMSITAATALVAIDPEKAITQILPLAARRQNWPRNHVGRLLHLAGPRIASDNLCRAIAEADNDTACFLLQFYETAHVSRIDSLVAQLLITRSNPRLLSAALKAVRGHLPAEIVERCARHKVWFVRMQTANLLGRFGRREDYRLLEPMLCDKEWWVRYRAAQAITRLPFLGPNSLRKLRDRQTDRFGQEIMVQALAEAGLQ